MRNRLQRLYGRGDLHFITFSCYRRRPFLGTPRARHRFVNRLDQVRTRYASWLCVTEVRRSAISLCGILLVRYSCQCI